MARLSRLDFRVVVPIVVVVHGGFISLRECVLDPVGIAIVLKSFLLSNFFKTLSLPKAIL